MDATWIAGVAIGLLLAWTAFIGLLWVLRPRDVALRELVAVVPDVLRLVRDLLTDRTVALRPRLALLGLLVCGW